MPNENKTEVVNTNELETLQNLNQAYAKDYSNSMLRSELMRRRLKVIDCMNVIKYIDSSLNHLSRASKVYAKWLAKAGVLSVENKQKALNKIPEDKRSEYEKMPTALEIRTRYKFEDKPTEYQDMKVGVEYNKWLYKFMENDDA
ncbi:hypothetical protein R2F61_07405 [Mollicutes bacterium LVI A0078]|nr:hypothetical protein RZE84_07185 [Mollicutes bacterium LVI A0075]WOO90550.1 hypothetical protein R2F61_07405 [Mollicutes bacterium LVI A0078]